MTFIQKLINIGLYNRRIYRQIFLDPVNKGIRIKLFANFLRWHLFHKYFKREFHIQFKNGFKSIVKPYPDHDSGEENIWTRNVDLQQLEFIEKNINQGDTIIDAGCNVGNRTLALAHKLSGALLVDAGLQAIARTKENLQLNQLSLVDFKPLNFALGASPGVVRFSNLGGASTLNQIVTEPTNTKTY